MVRVSWPAVTALKRTAHAHAARLYPRNQRDLAGIEHLIEIVFV